MPLTDLAIKKLAPKEKPFRVSDEKGLVLQVQPNGSKYWQFRYRFREKEKLLSLGVYPELTLARARVKRDDARKLLADGVDPSAAKKQKRADEEANLFSAVANAWYEFHRPRWAKKTADKCRSCLDNDILPILGDRPIYKIEARDTAEVIARIEARGSFNIAKKGRQWLRRIFSYAIAKGFTKENPASDLNEIAAPIPKSKPHPFLLEEELPEFLRAVQSYEGRATTKTAAWLVILTAIRPGVVRFAEWQEFDLDKAIWDVPAEKMKMRRPHLVPLPRQLVVMLRGLHKLTGTYRFVFPGQGGYAGRESETMSENTINKAFANLGYKGRMTGHGSRHTASTLLHEHGWDSKFIDAQLSHKKKDQDAPSVRGDYNHAIYVPQRREMMQWYADYLDKLASGEVAPRSPRDTDESFEQYQKIAG